MKKTSIYKNLYAKARKHRADNASTRQFEDSLEITPSESPSQLPNTSAKFIHKLTHARTQSCPFTTVGHTNKEKKEEKDQFIGLVSVSRRKEDGLIRQKQQKTKDNSELYGSSGNHKHTSSQQSLQSGTVIVHSLGVDHLSSLLYQCAGNQLKKNQLTLKCSFTAQRRQEQQIKEYELKEQLRQVRKQAEDGSVRIQVLQELLRKYGGEMLASSF